MKEETKEDYLARHRREQGLQSPVEITEDAGDENKPGLKARLKSLLFLLLFALFLWTILQIFGMLKSN